MINILHIIYSLEPGGAEQIAFSLASNMNRAKYRAVICSLRGGGLLMPRLTQNGVPTYILYKKRGLDPAVPWRLYRILRRENIHVIHAHNFSANFWGRITGIMARVPGIVCSEHSLCTHKSFLQRRVDSILSRHTDRIIAVSEAVRQTHIEDGRLPEEKITTIYNGISRAQFRGIGEGKAARRRLGLKEEDKIVGIVGSLTPAKDHRSFLEAAVKVSRTVPNARFVIVGDGPLRNEMARLLDEKCLGESTMLLGFREDRLDIMAAFDVAVLSSVREGLPLTLLEYMALGKPIVVTDVGGMPEAIVHGDSGYVVPAQNGDMLADRTIDLLQNRKMALMMGIRASERFRERFTEGLMVKQCEAIYEEVLGKKSER